MSEKLLPDFIEHKLPQIDPDHIKIEPGRNLPTLFDSFQRLDQHKKEPPKNP